VALPINVPPVPHLYNKDTLLSIIHGIDNPVPPLTHTIAILLGELFTSRWSRIISQVLNTLYNLLAILLSSNPLDLLHSRRLDQEIISSHCV
jgi:hypothetical protein